MVDGSIVDEREYLLLQLEGLEKDVAIKKLTNDKILVEQG